MRKLLCLAVTAGVLTCLCGCTKMDARGNLTRSGIAFTFDDFSVSEWYRCLPLFDSFQVKATYYISNYNLLTKEEIAKLKVIQQHGHEIAFHGTNHFNMVKYLNNAGMQKLLASEVTMGLKRMHKDSFYPTTFAYPYGQHNAALDNELLKQFKSVRALNGTNNYAKSLATVSNNSMLYGLGIDESSKRQMSTILQMVHNAYSDNACLVLVSHHIDVEETPFKTRLSTLRTIIQEADKLGMSFYTVAEISR